MTSERNLGWSAFVLRLGFAALFGFLGVGKMVAGYGAWVSRASEPFAGSWLPALAWSPFLHALPYIEIALGALLLAGLALRWVWPLTGLLLAALVAGAALRGTAGDAIANLTLTGAWAIGMALSEHDRFSLDAVLERRRR